MKIEWCLLISLTILVLVAVSTAIIYDPALLPDPFIKGIAYMCIGVAGSLIIWGCYRYFTIKVQEDWRLGLVRFFVLYFYLIVGFGSAYYLISDDFKDASQTDVALEKLRSELTERQKQIPRLQEEAKMEYEKWNELESERKALIYLIGEVISRRTRDELQRRLPSLPDDPQPLYKELESVEDKQKQLNQDLIAEHNKYLAAKLFAEKADAEVRKYSYFNFVYFSTVTIATVGYGDITPKTRGIYPSLMFCTTMPRAGALERGPSAVSRGASYRRAAAT